MISHGICAIALALLSGCAPTPPSGPASLQVVPASYYSTYWHGPRAGGRSGPTTVRQDAPAPAPGPRVAEDAQPLPAGTAAATEVYEAKALIERMRDRNDRMRKDTPRSPGDPWAGPQR